MSIAFDTAGYSRTGTTSTVTLAAAEANEIALIYLWPGLGTVSSAPTVNGVSATLIASKTGGSNNMYLYAFLNPPTSSVTYSGTGSATVEIHVLLYKGVNQSLTLDSFATPNGVSPFTLSTTVVGANAWLVSAVRNYDTGVGTPGTGTTSRNAGVGLQSGDSNGTVSTGSQSMQWLGNSPGDNMMGIIVSLIPPTPSYATVDTLATTDITHNEATFNGEVTDVGAGSVDERGFVWGTSSQSDPGNVAPSSAGYDDYDTESGSFSTGTFDFVATGLTVSTTYYVRAYAHNSVGYSYGDEVSFDTDDAPSFRFTNLPGIVFDEDDTTTIYAERLNNILERLEALE